MFNFNDLFGKIKEMQAEMEKTRQMLDEITVIGESGGGMIKVEANCNRVVLRVEVDPDLVNEEDKEMMEDLIAAAVNQAMEKADARSKEEMQKVTQGAMPNIPGLDLSNFGM